MKLGISPSVPVLGIQAALRIAESAERAGFDTVAFGEATYEPFAACAALAGATEQIEIMTAVAGWWRTPALTALSALTVQEVAGDRFLLGLGTGASRVGSRLHGLNNASVIARMREYVEAIRALLQAGCGDVSYRGRFFKVEGPLRTTGPPVAYPPIHLAAARRQMAALAGEVADGVVFARVHTRRYLEKVLLPSVGRPIERSVFVRCLPDRAGREVLVEAVERETGYVSAVREATGEPWEEVVSGSIISGTPTECRSQLRRYYDLVDRVVLTAPSGLSASETEAALSQIIDTFGNREV